MRSKIRIATAIALAFGAVACSDSTGPGDDAPRIEEISAATAPNAPPGNVLICYVNGDATQVSNTCPVIKYNGITYWAFGYVDNRNALNLVAYNDDEEILRQQELEGARNLWQMTVDSQAETVILWGQGSATATIEWSELIVSGG